MFLQRNLPATDRHYFLQVRRRGSWVYKLYSLVLFGVSRSRRMEAATLSLPSLHTSCCALRGWTLNVVVFARDASASVPFQPRPS